MRIGTGEVLRAALGLLEDRHDAAGATPGG
jgi:hypothetical protein